MKYHWIKDIKSPEDFPPRFQKLAREIGIEATLQVLKEFEGQNIYFYKIEDGFRDIWHNQIRKRWRKHNLKELALEFGVSEQTIRNIVHDHEKQIDLFHPQL